MMPSYMHACMHEPSKSNLELEKKKLHILLEDVFDDYTIVYSFHMIFLMGARYHMVARMFKLFYYKSITKLRIISQIT